MPSLLPSNLILALLSLLASITHAIPRSVSDSSQPRRLNMHDVVIQYSTTTAPLQDLRGHGLYPTTAIFARDDIMVMSVDIYDFGRWRAARGKKTFEDPIRIRQARIIWAQENLKCQYICSAVNENTWPGELVVFGSPLRYDESDRDYEDGEDVSMIRCNEDAVTVYNGLE